MKKSFFRCFLLALVSAGAGAIAMAQTPILLYVDASDRSAVQFVSTTGNAASDNDQNYTLGDGIWLEGFLNKNPEKGGSQSASSSLGQRLRPVQNSISTTYNWAAWRNTDTYLQIYTVGAPSGPEAEEQFVKDLQALEGSLVVDLSSLVKSSDDIGSGGNLYAWNGNSLSAKVLIGTWTYGPSPVPEPPEWAAMTLASVGLAGIFLRRRSRARA